MKVSIITVAYNAAATITDTLQSVAAQTYGDIEHLVIDGASTDNTADLVAAHGRPGTIFHSAPDKGLYDAMNKGLAAASGDIIGFLNADDYYCRSDAVSLIAAATTANRGAPAVSGGVAIVDGTNPDRLRRAYPSTPFARWMLRFGHMPPHPGFYVRRAVFDRIGGFDPALAIGADFEWMLRFYHDAGLHAAAMAPTLVTLRDGGVSNSGLASRRTINSEALASLRRHGIASTAPVIWSKYLIKALQYVVPPKQWPAPAAVRWPPDALQAK